MVPVFMEICFVHYYYYYWHFYSPLYRGQARLQVYTHITIKCTWNHKFDIIFFNYNNN